MCRFRVGVLTSKSQIPILRHQGILQFNSILTVSAWRQLQIPWVSSVPQDSSPRLKMPVQAPVISGCRLEVPVTPLLGLINLLEQLELSEIFYLLDYQFIIKAYNSRTARWKRCIELSWGRSMELPCPLWVRAILSKSPHPSLKFANPLLSGFYGGFVA